MVTYVFQNFTHTAWIAARSFTSCAESAPPEMVGRPTDDEDEDGLVADFGVVALPAGVLDVPVG